MKSKQLHANIAPPQRLTASEVRLQKHFSFRVAVRTDRERDHMNGEPHLFQQLTGALLRVGYPADACPFVHFRIESQETVDRDYGGSWIEESEMP